MEQSSNPGDPPPSPSMVKQTPMTPQPCLQFQALTPPWKSTPREGVSTLYDSYEFMAFAHQLNRALHGTWTGNSPYPSHLRSPANPFLRYFTCLFEWNGNTVKRVTYPQAPAKPLDASARNKGTKGLIPRIWKKLNHTFLRRKRA